MTAKARRLVNQWRRELRHRDGGAAAKETWKIIEKLIKPEEQVKLLKNVK